MGIVIDLATRGVVPQETSTVSVSQLFEELEEEILIQKEALVLFLDEENNLSLAHTGMSLESMYWLLGQAQRVVQSM